MKMYVKEEKTAEGKIIEDKNQKAPKFKQKL